MLRLPVSCLAVLWAVLRFRWSVPFAVISVRWPVGGFAGRCGDAVLRWAFVRLGAFPPR